MRYAILLRSMLVGVAAASLAATASPAAEFSARSYTLAHRQEILAEFESLLSLPNDASDASAIGRNAEFIAEALHRRGFATRLVTGATATPPSVFAERRTPGASKTILFYAHYDGQPVVASEWASPPYEPTVRAGASPDSVPVDWKRGTPGDEWRIFARSAGDDKATIIALLAAVDALDAGGRKPSVNVKLLFEGEEEKGSPHLPELLRQNRQLLKADMMVLGDGPIHQSGRTTLFFGARGYTLAELTAYGPARPLHDGHYGNWAPNPTVMLARLLAEARDDDGRILIPGFNEDVRPLRLEEIRALRAEPPVEDRLRRELAIGRTELDPRLPIATSQPAMNVRGFQAGPVGAGAVNAVPSRARASIDFRIVPDQRPPQLQRRFEEFARARGWFVVHGEPSAMIRYEHPKVLRIEWQHGYAAYRTDMASPAAIAVRKALERSSPLPLVIIPILGGSVPMTVFSAELEIPVIGVPIANYDDNQHAANENLRLGNLWSGIDVYAALLTIGSW